MAELNLASATDWVGNEAIARRALQADPDSEWSNGILATVLAKVGRMQEAADAMRKANAANPLALDWSTENARMSALAGRTQEASDEAADVAKAWPNEGGARAGRLQVAAILGDWNEALALLDESGKSPLTDPVRSCFLALKTPTPAAREKARAQVKAAATQPGGFEVAFLCLARMGYVDDAFDVARSYRPDDPNGLQAGELFGPEAAGMRRDPRFMQLANRIGLVRYWHATGKWPDFCAEPGLPYDCKAEAARMAAAHG
jgi:hypothetical protein